MAWKELPYALLLEKEAKNKLTYVLMASGAILFAYLVGSINFAIIFSRLFTGKDIRQIGSGNAGATNVLRSAGFLPGFLTFLFDAVKGFVACFTAKQVFEYIYEATQNSLFSPLVGSYICVVFVMLGHIFPVFFRFKGGKAVAVSVGTYAVCCYPAILLGLLVFAVSLFISKIVSLSSLLATVTVVTMSIVFMDFSEPAIPQIVCTIIAGFLVFIKHKENIIRLKNGEEKKISIGAKKKHG